MTAIEVAPATTAELVVYWHLYAKIDSEYYRNITRTIELELSGRPIQERLAAGYLK